MYIYVYTYTYIYIHICACAFSSEVGGSPIGRSFRVVPCRAVLFMHACARFGSGGDIPAKSLGVAFPFSIRPLG